MNPNSPLEQQTAVGAALAAKHREFHGVQSRLKPLPHVVRFNNWRGFTNELSGMKITPVPVDVLVALDYKGSGGRLAIVGCSGMSLNF